MYPITHLPMRARKRLGLIAHDRRKEDLLDWCAYNRPVLEQHELFATGTTGSLVAARTQLPVTCFRSGPLGGDQQVGAKIADGEIDFLIFFWDPLQPMPHDPDVKALLRIAVVWNIPVACSWATANFMISSTLMEGEYERILTDYDGYKNRKLTV